LVKSRQRRERRRKKGKILQGFLASAVPLLYWLGLAMIPLAVIQLWLNYWLAGRE
jgi:hypothetical protein